MIIENPLGIKEDYEILKCFPFSSERKRMGIIVRRKSDEKIIFYVKGADDVMRDIVSPGNLHECLAKCDEFSR